MYFFAVGRPRARECCSLLGFHASASDSGASQDSQGTRDHLYAVHGVEAVVERWSRSVHDHINAVVRRRTMLDVIEARDSNESRRSKDQSKTKCWKVRRTSWSNASCHQRFAPPHQLAEMRQEMTMANLTKLFRD